MASMFFWIMVLAFGAGTLTALVLGRGALARWSVASLAILGGGAGLGLGAQVILTGTAFSITFPDLLPLAGGLALRLDGLGAFFLVLIGLGAIPSALYGATYTAEYEEGGASMRMMGAMFSLFLATMALVTMADNVLTFLLMWEGMSLTSYYLVTTESSREDTVSAGNWYIAMTHVGLALLLGAFLLLMGGDTAGSFAALRAQADTLSSTVRSAIFLLAFLGFGSKAGIMPLHVWLPRAHPAAPSHVSALMSGVMIKLGIYGLLRFVLDLLGGGPVWWGGLILGIGAVSALLGVLYALMEHDLKRLLAYHSVENIGIILLGIGAGLMFQSYGMMALAALGIIGGLYHTLNHATFKSLLFLGAGAVLHATHTRNMEEMGGLIKKMPWTALFFLIGSAAISAIPPLNGFASEWMVFQSLLGGFKIPVPEVSVVMPIAVGMLALTSGLAAACFVKAFGITFLALPRSEEAEQAHEVSRSMRTGMGALALACVAFGLGPTLIVPRLGQILAGFPGFGGAAHTTFALQTTLVSPAAFGQVSPLFVGIGLVVILALVPLVLHVFRVNFSLRKGETWGCGRVSQTARMEYTATSFAEPLRRVFAEIYRPTRELTVDTHEESRYFIHRMQFRSEIIPWFEKRLYQPLLRFLNFVACQVRRLQAGSAHLYLAYVAVVMILLLLIARWY